MENLPNCPKCNSEYTYEDGSLLVCPECAHEWNPSAQEEENVIKDVNGNVLNDGDSVTVVKDLKVKGASSSIKIATKVKNKRLSQKSIFQHNHCQYYCYHTTYLYARKTCRKFYKFSTQQSYLHVMHLFKYLLHRLQL